MTLRPADDHDRGGQRPVDPDRQSGSETTLSHGLGRLRDVVRSIGARVRRYLGAASDPSSVADDRIVHARQRRRRLEAPRPFRYDSEPPELTECPSVDGLPPRDRPLTVPARDESWDNQPDLVVEESDDQLTLSMPDEPDAMITSDVWKPIEP